MKYWISTLVILLGLLLPASAFAWNDEAAAGSQPDDTAFYELTYTQCAFRHASSSYSENEIECLCDKVAANAVKWRRQVPADKIPPVDEEETARCLYNR